MRLFLGGQKGITNLLRWVLLPIISKVLLFTITTKEQNSVSIPIVAAFQPNLGTTNFMSWMPNSNNGINDLWNGDLLLSLNAIACKTDAYVTHTGT